MVQFLQRGENGLAEIELADGTKLMIPATFVPEGSKAGSEITLSTSTPQPRTPARQGGRAEQAFQFYVDQGLAPHQAAGIVGNAMQESGSQLSTTAVGDNGTAFGMFQHRGQRFANLRSFANQLGKDWRDTDVQLLFPLWEMGYEPLQESLGVRGAGFGSEQSAGRKLFASGDVRSATEAMVSFERPQGWTPENPSGGHGFANRLKFAQTVASGAPSGRGGQSTGITADAGAGATEQRQRGVTTSSVGPQTASDGTRILPSRSVPLGRAAPGASRTGDTRTRGEFIGDIVGGAISGAGAGAQTAGGFQPTLPNFGATQQMFQQQAQAGPLPGLPGGIGTPQTPNLRDIF